jgi:flagellar biosynthesis regulator FlaF
MNKEEKQQYTKQLLIELQKKHQQLTNDTVAKAYKQMTYGLTSALQTLLEAKAQILVPNLKIDDMIDTNRMWLASISKDMEMSVSLINMRQNKKRKYEQQIKKMSVLAPTTSNSNYIYKSIEELDTARRRLFRVPSTTTTPPPSLLPSSLSSSISLLNESPKETI